MTSVEHIFVRSNENTTSEKWHYTDVRYDTPTPARTRRK